MGRTDAGLSEGASVIATGSTADAVGVRAELARNLRLRVGAGGYLTWYDYHA